MYRPKYFRKDRDEFKHARQLRLARQCRSTTLPNVPTCRDRAELTFPHALDPQQPSSPTKTARSTLHMSGNHWVTVFCRFGSLSMVYIVRSHQAKRFGV